MAGLYKGDKQISGNLEQARIVSKKKPHSDLDLSLKIHPIRKDIIPLKDDAAIKNAVRNLLISNFYERPFQDDLGANLRGLLVGPVGVLTFIDFISAKFLDIIVGSAPSDCNDVLISSSSNLIPSFETSTNFFSIYSRTF